MCGRSGVGLCLNMPAQCCSVSEIVLVVYHKVKHCVGDLGWDCV